MSVHDEVEALYAAAKARALLRAIEWAGSASALATQAGFTRFAGIKWVQRSHIPWAAALRLIRVEGFPVGLSEMCPDVYKTARKTKRQCPHCDKVINLPRQRTGCSPLLKKTAKRPRKKPAPKPGAAGAKPKSKTQTAKRKPA